MANNSSSDVSATTTPLERKRHSLAHILAAALREKYPDVKLAIGPAVDNGFYYDIELSSPLSSDDLPAIEARMKEMVQEKLGFERSELSIDDAIAQMKEAGAKYKVEILEDLKSEGEETVSFYQTGEFMDLCRGGHVENTKDIHPESFQLDRVAGAYWRGDESREQLQRVYGLAFDSKKELKQYLAMREEAKKRDHRKIGPAMDLFRISPEVGPGLPIIMKNGMVLWNGMANHLRKMMRKYYRGNVHELHTAHIGSQKLYEISGHWEKYKDDNFPPMELDDRAYMMKPMNCPHHIQAFTHKPLSYRDLPYRTFEIGTAYRLEQSGELSGLTRVRSLSIDDAHLFVANEEQLKEEIRLLLLIVKETYDKLGLNDYRATLSVRDPKTPEKYIGNPKDWDRAEQALADALEENDALLPGNGFDREEGEAAFYGPKIDLKFRDALGREHQLSTIQVDYNFPERFDLTYVGEDGANHRPIMIHRALLGSMERFMGIYIEHTGGAFPTWLAPTQVLLLPVSDESVDYARAVEAQLFDAGVRVEVDDSKESVGKKIRNGVSKKAPYMIVIGEKEQESGVFPIRVRGSQETEDMPLDAFLVRLAEEDDSIRA